MSTKDILLAAGGSAAIYSEDVFRNLVRVGTGSSASVVTGIDLATYGGAVFMKDRFGTGDWAIYDTVRGTNHSIGFNLTSDQVTETQGLLAFNNNGHSVGTLAKVNGAGNNIIEYTFRRASGFFDVLAYAGNGGTPQAIRHNLGVKPKFIIVKAIAGGAGSPWVAYHEVVGPAMYDLLGSQQVWATDSTIWNGVDCTATHFTVGSSAWTNQASTSYIAYLWGGPLILAGKTTSDSGGFATLGGGWEPVMMMLKANNASTPSSWGWGDSTLVWDLYASNDQVVFTHTNAAELFTAERGWPYHLGANLSRSLANTDYYGVFVRRAPTRPITSGTQVFCPVAFTGTGASKEVIIPAGWNADVVIAKRRDVGSVTTISDRARASTMTVSHATNSPAPAGQFDVTYNSGYGFVNSASANASGGQHIHLAFRKAPGFFETVHWAGNGTAKNIPHGLGVAPELIICKDFWSSTTTWTMMYHSALGPTKYITLNDNYAVGTASTVWNDTAPTASVFTVGTDNSTNLSSGWFTYYLFASMPGISKVGSYVGNGTSQTIDCGFTTGARFVTVREYNAVGSWWFWDSARGIQSGNESLMSMDGAVAEYTTYDVIDPHSSGFIIKQGGGNCNASGASYIFLAIS